MEQIHESSLLTSQSNSELLGPRSMTIKWLTPKNNLGVKFYKKIKEELSTF